MKTAKDAEDREKCPDPRVSTENLMTSTRALNRLAALPNFMDIQGEDRESVCDLFDPSGHLIQLQIPAHLYHLGKLRFMEQHLTDDKLYEQCCVNTLLPRPHHPDLDNIPLKHQTRALAAVIHYHLHK